MMRNVYWVSSAVLVSGFVLGACSTDDGDGGGGSGGASSGGAASGGDSSGGAASGGAASGGAASGGAASGGAASGGTGGYTTTENKVCDEIAPLGTGASASFVISSPDFESCAPIPDTATCDGREFAQGSSPALTWAGAPDGTLSYAIVFKDISILADNDPETKRFGLHWVIWDIPAATTSLPANLATGHLPAAVAGARQWASRNDYGYFGPCPNPFPEGDAMFSGMLTLDSYAFVLYALDVATLEDLPEPDVNDEGMPTGNWVVKMDDYLLASDSVLAITEYRGTSDAWSTAFAPPDPVEFPCTGETTTGCLAPPP